MSVFPQDAEGARWLPERLVQQVEDASDKTDDDGDNVQEPVNSSDTVDICIWDGEYVSSNLGK